MTENWTAFEHQIWKCLKENSLEGHNNFILAVSGGLDSMVLLEVFLNLRPQAKIKVASYHHGPSGSREQDEFRELALEAVKHKISRVGRENVIFCSEKSEFLLEGEEQMRAARWKFLRGLKVSDEIFVTAHHLDDRLETMLLKMLRGTSLDGFLAFRMWNDEIFRPFLNTAKNELTDFAKSQSIGWVEDPSNRNEQYLRNWIREKWLKELDEKVQGGSKNLAKSLLKIVDSAIDKSAFELVFVPVLEPDKDYFVLCRQWYVSLSRTDQLRGLALFLKKHQIHSFTTGHLEEIRKRLDKNQNNIRFELLGKKWVINASRIVLL